MECTGSALKDLANQRTREAPLIRKHATSILPRTHWAIWRMILLEVQRRTPWHLERSGSLYEKDRFSWALKSQLRSWEWATRLQWGHGGWGRWPGTEKRGGNKIAIGREATGRHSQEGMSVPQSQPSTELRQGRLETRTLLVFKTHCVSQWRRDIRLHLQEGRHEDLPRRAHDGWSVKGQSSPSTRQLQCHLESHRPLLCMTGILPTGGRCCRKTETFKTALMTQAPGMPRLGWQEQNQFHEQLTMCLPLKTLVGV